MCLLHHFHSLTNPVKSITALPGDQDLDCWLLVLSGYPSLVSSGSSSSGNGLPRAGGVNFLASTSSATVASTMPSRKPAGMKIEVPKRPSMNMPSRPGLTINTSTAIVRESHCIELSNRLRFVRGYSSRGQWVVRWVAGWSDFDD